MKKNLICVGFAVLLLCAWRAYADSEGGNWPFVVAATTDGTTSHGGYYARCIPTKLLGTSGVTTVYRVEKEQDIPVHTNDWYATQIYMSGANRKVSIVRFGPWSKGHRASQNDLALALYYDGQLLKAYSTLDIVGQPEKVETSVSHYRWCKRVIGYGHYALPPSAKSVYGFGIETLDGRKLFFNAFTGEMSKDMKRVRSVSTSSRGVVVDYED